MQAYISCFSPGRPPRTLSWPWKHMWRVPTVWCLWNDKEIHATLTPVLSGVFSEVASLPPGPLILTQRLWTAHSAKTTSPVLCRRPFLHILQVRRNTLGSVSHSSVLYSGILVSVYTC